MSKGSTPRPFEIPRKQYEDNFERIFGKKQPTPQNQQKKPKYTKGSQ
jgi:hypothetical protein